MKKYLQAFKILLQKTSLYMEILYLCSVFMSNTSLLCNSECSNPPQKQREGKDNIHTNIIYLG